MRRSLFVLVLALVAPLASAQRAGLGFAALPAPGAGHALLERSSHHACSRSYASTNGRATLELSVDAAGAARLVLDGRSDETSGSRMDGDSSHTFHLHRVELSGTGRRAGSNLVLQFTRVAAGSGWWEGYGTAPPPTLSTSPITLELTCALSAEGVLPAEWSEQEAPVPEQLLRCEVSSGALPAAFDSYGEPPLFFGSGEAVRTVIERGVLAPYESRVLRRVP